MSVLPKSMQVDDQEHVETGLVIASLIYIQACTLAYKKN